MNIYENESEVEALRRVNILIQREREAITLTVERETLRQLRELVRGEDEIPKGKTFVGRYGGLACFCSIESNGGAWVVRQDGASRHPYGWTFVFADQPTDLHVNADGHVVFAIGGRFWGVDQRAAVNVSKPMPIVQHWFDHDRDLSLPEEYNGQPCWTTSKGRKLWDEHCERIRNELSAKGQFARLTLQREMLELRALIRKEGHELPALPTIPRPIAQSLGDSGHPKRTQVLGVSLTIYRDRFMILTRGSDSVMTPALRHHSRWTANGTTISFETRKGWVGYNSRTLECVEPIPYQLNYAFELITATGRVYVEEDHVYVANGLEYVTY